MPEAQFQLSESHDISLVDYSEGLTLLGALTTSPFSFSFSGLHEPKVTCKDYRSQGAEPPLWMMWITSDPTQTLWTKIAED